MSDCPEESAEMLLARAAGLGEQVSRSQLKRWHSAGLLLRPRRRSLGKTRGTASLYPPGTWERLRRVLQLRSDPRRFLWQETLWQLWWEGWPVDHTSVIRMLNESCKAWHEITTWAESVDAPSMTMSQLEGMNLKKLPEPLRDIRRHPQGGAVIAVLLQIAAGKFADFEDSNERRAFLQGTGLDRAQQDRSGQSGPWLRGVLGDQLVEIAELTGAVSMHSALQNASEADLIRARDQVQHFQGIVFSLSLTVADMGRAGMFGLRLVPDPREISPRVAQWLVLVWLVLSEQGRLDGFQAISAMASTFAPPEVFIDIGRGTAKGLPGREQQTMRGKPLAEGSSE